MNTDAYFRTKAATIARSPLRRTSTGFTADAN
jgi:hypothetical protein